MAFNRMVGLEHLIAKDEDDFVRKVTDKEWLADSMKGGSPEAIFDDARVTKALDEFLLKCVPNV